MTTGAERTPLIAGNWEMHKTIAEAEAFIQALLPRVSTAEGVDVAICPPFTSLQAMVDSTRGSRVQVYAQTMHQADHGAFTGEVSASMLGELDVHGVILGHSERRADQYETDEMVRAKALAAWRAKLTAIVCVGETQAEREAGHMLDVVARQLAGSLPDGATPQNLVVAYEPVWAIGTGHTASEKDVAMMHAFIREELVRQFGADTGRAIRILYGGSVKPSNAAALLAVPEVGGALIGGASLKADEFLAIARAASARR